MGRNAGRGEPSRSDPPAPIESEARPRGGQLLFNSAGRRKGPVKVKPVESSIVLRREAAACGNEASMQVETNKTHSGGRVPPDAAVLVRGGVVFVFCHVLFIGLAMLVYFAN